MDLVTTEEASGTTVPARGLLILYFDDPGPGPAQHLTDPGCLIDSFSASPWRSLPGGMHSFAPQIQAFTESAGTLKDRPQHTPDMKGKEQETITQPNKKQKREEEGRQLRRATRFSFAMQMTTEERLRIITGLIHPSSQDTTLRIKTLRQKEAVAVDANILDFHRESSSVFGVTGLTSPVERPGQRHRSFKCEEVSLVGEEKAYEFHSTGAP
ncbi:hypothetical protein PROFUN_13621 [Planoprotostelium fungivorum]|uniref:Uncharacterized protein n=1 Tax=Planoprotostelium fungivorum TaxID=1890364 RepID=A0A2P6MZV2_9EUKA|nr:hypothetical protein PROFUN_13621 [Planoprotostelium fungivorum]